MSLERYDPLEQEIVCIPDSDGSYVKPSSCNGRRFGAYVKMEGQEASLVTNILSSQDQG